MRTVELIKGIHSSVLGFGCAPIMGSVDAKTAKYALDFALDHGINHLDLARSYGYGEAERFVGKLVKENRHKIVLASKFGIKPNWKASLLKSVKPMIRTVRNQVNKHKIQSSLPPSTSVTNIAGSFLNRIVPVRSKDMRNSLEKSLRELGSDYLDYFFIHEPQHTLTYFEELRETAEILKTEGKIRGWGIAYMQSQRNLHSSYIDEFDLLQFNNPPELHHYENLVLTRGFEPNVIFSPIRGGGNNLKPTDKIKKLLDDFPNSVILCSMFNLDHLKQNVSII
ncbi:MAG: Aldo/keto reductase [Mucilaginibacter sp.]|nr:Aldo/keto reductase [Mucilaginibacter sp.]